MLQSPFKFLSAGGATADQWMMVTNSRWRSKSYVLKFCKSGAIVVVTAEKNIRTYGIKPLDLKSKVRFDPEAIENL